MSRGKNAGYQGIELVGRNQLIWELHREGLKPANIAERFDISAEMVRQILLSMGEREVGDSKYANFAAEEWRTEDDNVRRRLITERAARGARQRLREIAAENKRLPVLSPLFTQPTGKTAGNGLTAQKVEARRDLEPVDGVVLARRYSGTFPQ